jgi:predicted flap endonuclease-1-like 5' DNA nuclease
MDEVQARNAPSFGGWFMAAGAAAVAFGVAMVIFDFRVPQASLVAAVLFLAVGLILGQPDRPMPAAPKDEPQAAPQVVMTPSRMLADMSPVQTAHVAKSAAEWTAAIAAKPVAGKKPEGLAAARGGHPDDLKIIKGIGPALEKLCHSLGYYHFDQIATWTAAEIAWVDDNLEGFKGRVTRDEWVSQARILAAGGTL